MSENRAHERLFYLAKIRMFVEPKPILVMLRDLSISGMFIMCDPDIFEKGERVRIQAVDVPDAPIVEVEVVRVSRDRGNRGYGVRFVGDDSN